MELPVNRGTPSEREQLGTDPWLAIDRGPSLVLEGEEFALAKRRSSTELRGEEEWIHRPQIFAPVRGTQVPQKSFGPSRGPHSNPCETWRSHETLRCLGLGRRGHPIQ